MHQDREAERDEELYESSRFGRVPPHSELERVVLDRVHVSEVQPRLIIFHVPHKVPVLPEEHVVSRGGQGEVFRPVATAPDLLDNVFGKRCLKEIFDVKLGDQI